MPDIFDIADMAYERGEKEKAAVLFLQAANAGDNNAMSRIALMYSEGEGVEKSIEKSIEWDLKAIQKGNTSSMLNIAITYRTIGNILESKKWLETAIEAGNHEAALDLAKLYMVSNMKDDKISSLLFSIIKSNSVSEECKEEAAFLIKKYNNSGNI